MEPPIIFVHHHDGDLSLRLTLAVRSAVGAGSWTNAAHAARPADPPRRKRIFGRMSDLASSSAGSDAVGGCSRMAAMNLEHCGRADGAGERGLMRPLPP
jgi:hypothetical protein